MRTAYLRVSWQLESRMSERCIFFGAIKQVTTAPCKQCVSAKEEIFKNKTDVSIDVSFSQPNITPDWPS